MKNNYTRLVLCVLVGSLVVFAAKVTTIRAAVDAQFAAKGWAKVAEGGDAAVAAFGSTHKKPRLETFYEGFGGGWFWRGCGGHWRGVAKSKG
jgi:hypothetical protein